MKMDNSEVVVSYTIVERDGEHSSINIFVDLLDLCFLAYHILAQIPPFLVTEIVPARIV